MSRGTIILLGGMNDIWVVARSWRWGLTWCGLPHALETFRWQQGFRAILTLADLWRTSHHRSEAERLADRVRAIHAERSGEPVHVFSHSAGTAITAYALEQLAPQEAVTSAVLVGSALSPEYDLSAALRGTRYGILTVESRLDLFFLGLGTRIFGTADRRWTVAAGMVGFREPSDPDQARKLYRTRWTLPLVRQGWVGGHTSIASPWFVRGTLAVWVGQAEAESGDGAGTSGSGLRANTHSSTG